MKQPFSRALWRTPLRRALMLMASLAAVAMASCSWVKGTVQDKQDEKPGIRLESLRAPEGHSVSVWATDLPKARHLAQGPDGLVFVGSMAGNVYALNYQGGAVTGKRILLKGLTDPSGIAFNNGTLYVADRRRILRYENIAQRLDNPPAPIVTVDGLPNKARHDAHAMAFGPDGKLYVSVGSPCNVCESTNDEYGLIIRVNADGSGREVVARGIRNSVGFDWHPRSNELWFTENGQDELGPDRPNDELNRVTKLGENFGFPYCHDRDIPDPKLGGKHVCSEFTPPAMGLGAHVAALGMRFDSRSAEPSILVARHGSHPPTRVAYDVVRVVMQEGQPTRIEPFLNGFLQGREYWGRPVDVLIMRDGATLVSDDLNGAIYRVARTGT